MDPPTAKRKVTAKIDYGNTSRPSPSGGSFASPVARSNTTPILPRARVKVIADPSPSLRPPLIARSPSVASFDGGTRSGPSTPSNVGVRQAMARAATAPVARSVIGQTTPGPSAVSVRGSMDRPSPINRQTTPRTPTATNVTPSSRTFVRTLSASSSSSKRGDDYAAMRSPDPRLSSSSSSNVVTPQASTSSHTQLSTPLSRLQRQISVEDPPVAFVSPRSPAREASRRARRIVQGDLDDRPGSPTRSEVSSRGSELEASSSRSSALSRDDQAAFSPASESKGTRTPQTSLGSSQGPGQGRSDGEDTYAAPRESLEDEEAREAKRDRKIADLEISNQSLMTINKALEAAAARKDRLISSLKRQLRASGQAPVSYFDLRNAGEGQDSAGDDSGEDDEEEDLGQRSRQVDDSLGKLNLALEDMVKRGREALKRVEETKEGERGKVLTALDLEEATYDDESPESGTPATDAHDD